MKISRRDFLKALRGVMVLPALRKPGVPSPVWVPPSEESFTELKAEPIGLPERLPLDNRSWGPISGSASSPYYPRDLIRGGRDYGSGRPFEVLTL